MIKVENTVRSYSGKRGCMCGCRGTYNETERARKLALTALLKDPTVKLATWDFDTEGCLYVLTASRTRVVYLTAEGVAQARNLGISEKA